jgi:hypothetical protein
MYHEIFFFQFYLPCKFTRIPGGTLARLKLADLDAALSACVQAWLSSVTPGKFRDRTQHTGLHGLLRG